MIISDIVIFLLLLNLIISSINLYEKVKLKSAISEPRAGTEYHNCEYCHRYLPEVIKINGHWACTNAVCRNHVGAVS